MGHITESYATLSELLLTHARSRKSPEREIFNTYFLKPLLPSAFRTGTGQVLDIKDRILGPFDIIGGVETLPPMGEGLASLFLIDGVAFCIQVRNWKEEDLTQFSDMAGKLRALVRKSKHPLFCAVVGFESLPAAQVSEFLKSAPGHPIDAVLSIGQHLMLRNTHGWYGDAQRIPYVTEKGAGESLKAFAFWIVQVAQSFLGTPYLLGDYQHL
jgi:hypothetical protein